MLNLVDSTIEVYELYGCLLQLYRDKYGSNCGGVKVAMAKHVKVIELDVVAIVELR
jgi:hypothetical protein